MLPEHRFGGTERTAAPVTYKTKRIKQGHVHGGGDEEFHIRTAQVKVELNRDTREDEQRGNQNPYYRNTDNSLTDEAENPSLYIETRNIGNLSIQDTNIRINKF